jgi:hypothetical protein
MFEVLTVLTDYCLNAHFPTSPFLQIRFTIGMQTDGNCKNSNFIACCLIRVQHTGQYDSINYRLVEYQTRCGINPHFKLAEYIPLAAKHIIL